MPETRIEKALFALGVLAIAALGFLVARLWHHTHSVATASTTSLSPPAPTTSETRQAKTTPATTETRPTKRARTTTPANTGPLTSTTSTVGPLALLLTAKTDTWLEIRDSTSTGPLLYNGTLAAGSTKHFHGRTFWARFGAAGNVLVRLGGKVIRMPSGTYDATFDGHGFRRLGA